MEEKIKYKGFDIEILQESQPELFNPREGAIIGKMICFHKRYKLGDKHSFSEPGDFIEFKNNNNIICLPLFLYDHSGITMNTTGFNCQWDSGQVGWIYADIKQINDAGFNWKKITKKRCKKILEWLKKDVEVYDHYLTGNIYLYNIEDGNGDILDSCGGFLGCDFKNNGLLEYAKEAIDYYILDKHKKHFNQLKIWIKNKVPLCYRTKLVLI